MKNRIKTMDAGIIFVFSVFFMTLVATMLLLILKQIFPGLENTDLYYTANYFCSQLTFFLAILLYANFRKLRFRDVGLNKQKINPLVFLVVLVISIVMTFGLNDINILFIKFMQLFGFNPTNIAIGSATPLNIILCVFLIGLAPAFVEELLVRGFVFSGLRQGYSAVSAVLLSAFMFAIMHMNVGQLLYQFLFGIIIAILVVLTKSIYASMALHACNNLIVLIMYFCGVGSEGDDVSKITYTGGQIVAVIFISIAALVGIFLLLLFVGYLMKKTDEKQQVQTEVIDMNLTEPAKSKNKVFGFIKEIFGYFVFKMSAPPEGADDISMNVGGQLLGNKVRDEDSIKNYSARVNKAVLWICIGGFMIVYIINLFITAK